MVKLLITCMLAGVILLIAGYHFNNAWDLKLVGIWFITYSHWNIIDHVRRCVTDSKARFASYRFYFPIH